MSPSKAATDAIRPLLAQIGYEKRAGAIFTTRLQLKTLGWLGLNYASRHEATGGVEINPMVGVRFQDVERELADLSGTKFHEYLPPTVVTSIGYLMETKSYKSWKYSVSSDAEALAEIVEAIVSYGLPYVHSVGNLMALREALEADSMPREQTAYRLPVVLGLLGKADRALEYVRREVERIESRSDGAAMAYRKFAGAFSDKYG